MMCFSVCACLSLVPTLKTLCTEIVSKLSYSTILHRENSALGGFDEQRVLECRGPRTLAEAEDGGDAEKAGRSVWLVGREEQTWHTMLCTTYMIFVHFLISMSHLPESVLSFSMVGALPPSFIPRAIPMAAKCPGINNCLGRPQSKT